tara:strand:- start:265 stop:549 length:285 start_codon:yes stop_codon:yes gene_type:complete
LIVLIQKDFLKKLIVQGERNVASRVRLGTVVKMKNGGAVKKKTKSGGKICPEGKAWAKRTFDTYPSAYANLAASKYCKDPNYAKKAKGGKRKGR